MVAGTPVKQVPSSWDSVEHYVNLILHLNPACEVRATSLVIQEKWNGKSLANLVHAKDPNSQNVKRHPITLLHPLDKFQGGFLLPPSQLPTYPHLFSIQFLSDLNHR